MKRQRKVPKKSFAEPLMVPVVEDDIEAVRLISAILGQFADSDKQRIVRWVMEKFGMGTGVLPAPLIVSPSEANIKPVMRNPHTMAKPPFNKIIIQDDDEEGSLLGIPKDADLAEPPEAELLKPNKETRRLVSVVDRHVSKDGTKVVESKSVVMR